MPDDFLDEIAKLTGRPFKTIAPTTNTRADALKRAADKLGVDAADLGSIISFETGGTLDPHKVGGEGNKYKGLIQFGPAEQKKYYNPKDTFETQVENGVVRYFQDRFKQAGKDTRGATLEDLYTTVIAGNPKANRNAKDSFGTSARSGTQRILKEHRPKVLKDIFGGALPTAQTDDLLDEVAKLTGRPFGKRTEPTNPVNTIPQSSKVLPTPVPETQTTLTSQMASLMDPASTRIGVLLTPGETPPVDLNPSKFRVFDTKNGAMVVNLAQAKKFKLRNPADIQGYLDTNPNAIAQFTGKVETNDDTGSGFAVVTYDKDGNEIHASKVTSSAAAIEQAKLDKNNFKDGVSQKVIPAQKVVEDRNLQLQREEIQKNALPGEQPYQTVLRLRREPAETAYKQFLTDTGLTDSDESRKEFSIAQNASIEGANRQNQADVAAYNAQLPKQQRQVTVTTAKPVGNTAEVESGDITFDVPLTNKPANVTYSDWVQDQRAEQLANRLNVDYKTVRKVLDSFEAKTKSGTANEAYYAQIAKQGEANKSQIGADVIEKIKAVDAKIKKQSADFDAKLTEYAAELAPGETSSIAGIRAAFDSGYLSEDEFLAQLAKEKDITARLRDELKQGANLDLTNIGQARLGNGKVGKDFDRDAIQPDVTKALEEIIREYGTLSKYADEQKRLKEEYKYRPLAHPIEFAKNFAGALPKAVASLLKTGDLVLNMNPVKLGADAIAGKGFTIDETVLSELGDGINKYLESVKNKDLKDDPIVTVLPDTLGQMAVQLAAGALTGGATLPTAIGAAMGAAAQYDEAKKFTKDDRQKILAATVGALAAVPDAIAFKSWFKTASPTKLASWLEKTTQAVYARLGVRYGEEVAKETTEKAITVFMRNLLKGSAFEGSQEVSENKINDWLALKTYDPSKAREDKLYSFNKEDKMSFLGGIIGGGSGSVVQTLSEIKTDERDAFIADVNAEVDKMVERGEIKPAKAAEVKAEIVKVSEEVKAKPQVEAKKVEPKITPKAEPKVVEKQVEPQVEAKPSKYRERISELAKELNLKKGVEQPDVEAAPSAPSDVSTTKVVDADVAVQASRSASLRRLKKIADFTTDEGKFANYDIDKDHRGRADMFVVLKDPNGYIVRNAFVPDAMQRSGLATELYQAMNTESLKKTGKPLRSTQPRTLVTGEVVHELTPDSIALWDSFVKKGVAEKLGDKDYRFLPTATKAKTPKAPVPTAPKQEGVKEPSVSGLNALHQQYLDSLGKSVSESTAKNAPKAEIDQKAFRDAYDKASPEVRQAYDVASFAKNPYGHIVPGGSVIKSKGKDWMVVSTPDSNGFNAIPLDSKVAQRLLPMIESGASQAELLKAANGEIEPQQKYFRRDKIDLVKKVERVKRKAPTTVESRREAGSPEVSTTRSEGAKPVAEKPSLTLIKSLRDLGYSLPMQKTLSEVEKKDIVDNKIKKKDYVKGNVTEKPDVADTPSNQPADVQGAVVEAKAEKVKPIRELGTGAKVYFETDKVRVNELTNGKIVLIAHDNTQDAWGKTNIEFDSPEEAVTIAAKLNKDYPKGYPPALLIDRVIEGWRSNETPSVKSAVPTKLDTSVTIDLSPTISKAFRKKQTQARLRKKGYTFERLGLRRVKITHAPQGMASGTVAGNFESVVFETDHERQASRKQTTRPQPKRPSLWQAVQMAGGIKPDNVNRGEVERISQKQLGKIGLVNKNGRSAEELAGHMWELGYLRDVFPTMQDVNGNVLIDEIENDARGIKKHYTHEQINEVAESIEDMERDHYAKQYVRQAREMLEAEVNMLHDDQIVEMFAKIEEAGDATYEQSQWLAKEFEEFGLPGELAEAVIYEIRRGERTFADYQTAARLANGNVEGELSVSDAEEIDPFSERSRANDAIGTRIENKTTTTIEDTPLKSIEDVRSAESRFGIQIMLWQSDPMKQATSMDDAVSFTAMPANENGEGEYSKRVEGKIPKTKFSPNWILDKIEAKANKVINYEKLRKLLPKVPGARYYKAQYGFGVENLYRTQEAVDRDTKAITEFLDKHNIEYRQRLSEQMWVTRFEISQSKANLAKLRDLLDGDESDKILFSTFDQTNLFGEPVSPVTSQPSLFTGVPAPKADYSGVQRDLTKAYGKETADYIAALSESVDVPLYRTAIKLSDARFLVMAKGEDARAIVEDAADALDIFASARASQSTVDDILRQERMDNVTFSDRAKDYALLMEKGTFSVKFGNDLSEVKTTEHILRSVPDTNKLNDIIDDRGNIDYGRAKDVAGRILSGKQEIRRLSPEGERGRIAGGRGNGETSVDVGADERAVQKASPATGSRVESDADTRLDTVEAEVRRQMDAVKEVRNDKGQLLAPNGKVSNLNEYQWKSVRTKNFIEFFGDWINDPENASKVVDENGEPIVAKHGTDNPSIVSFNTKEGGNRKSNQQLDFGTHFSADGDYIAGYTGRIARGKSPTSYPVFLSLQNPLDLTDGNSFIAYKGDPHFDALSQLAKALNIKPSGDNYYTREGVKQSEIQSVFVNQNYLDRVTPAKARQALLDAGYDGVIYEPFNMVGVTHLNRHPKSYIALNRTQIKSSISNNGNYDAGEGSILKKTRTTDAMDELETLKQARDFAQIVPKVESSVEDSNVVYLKTSEASEVMRTLISVVEGTARDKQPLLQGLFLTPNRLTDIKDALSALIDESDIDTKPLKSLLSNIEKAETKNGAIKLKVFDEALPHEEAHESSWLGSKGKPYVKRYANADKITSYEPFKRFKQELELRMGMKVNDGVALEEALAYLGTGDLLGVNIDEATEILALLVEGYAEANGVESLKNFKPGTQLYEAIEKRTESQSSKGSDGTRSNVSEGRQTGRETATAEDQGDAGTEAGFDKASGRDGVTPGKSGLPFDRVEAEKARKLGQKVAAFSRIIGHEYYYDPQNREATDTKAAQLVGKMGVSTAIDQALNGKPSAEGMRVVYWELERLAAQVDAHLLAGRTAEAASVATRAAELAAAIVQRQVAAGQEVEIGKTLATLSPESALIVASRMVRYATKDGKLSTKQSEATVKLANELRKEKAKLAEARLEIAKQRAKIRRLENDRPARKRVTSQDKLLKDYKSREGAILAKLREAFPNSPMFNGSVLRMVAGIRGVQNLPDAKVRQNNYVIAKSMDEAGLDAKRIWLATGWEKGKDGKWRNEIDDSDATLRPSSFLGRTSLGELLDFPEMFKAYPNLRNVTVTFEEKWSPGTRGALGKDQDGNLAIGINANLPMLQVQSTLLHEVQHAIQSLEGFARGGGVEGIPASYKERRAELYRQVGEYNDRLSKLVGKPEYESVMSEKLAVVRELQNLEANADSIVADSEDRYNRLAGEVEARNVQLRHYMTPAERAKSALSETEDVPRDKQIVRYGDGVSQSILRSVPDNGVRDALVEYAIGQILQNRTYEAVIGELQDISGLTTEQVKSIHASAVEVLRPARTSSDTAQADIRRIRQEHYKQAKAIDQNIDKKIDPAFKKKWNQNVRELGPIAQEAMKQFPDDTDLVMAVERLTGKSPKNINDVVKDLMGGGRSVPDATQLARKANSLVKAIKEQRAADKAKAEGKLQEALLSEREARIAAQKKAGELRKFLANLAADPNVIKRFNNDFRAKVVLNWGTQIFNGVQAMTIATPAEFALDVLEAGLRTVGVNVGDNVDMSPSLLAPWYVFATDRQMAEDALSHFPEAFYQLHAGLMGDIEIDPRKLAEEKTGLTKYAHKYFDANERLNEFLAKITGAKLQEMHFRNAQILTIFDGVIRSKTKGQESLKSALEHGTFTKYITEKEAQYAVDRALRVTMASQIDDPIGKQLKQAYDWLDNYVPVILNPVTFARFTYTASKVTVINPIMFGAMDSAKLGGQGYNNRSIAKGVLAWSGIAMAYGLQSLLGGDDDKWYTLYIFGKDKAPLDIRRFYPVSAYFYMAHLIRNFKDGRPLPSKSDLLAGFASLELDYFQYGAPMQALSTAGELWGGTKDWGDLGSDTAAVAASWFAGSTRFFKPMKDVLAQAWDKEAAMREYDESTADKVMKELGKSLPVNALYGENFNVPIKKDMKGNDVITPFPLARMIGVNIVHPSLLSKEDSVATEWANRLFPYTGSSSRMTLEERKAYNARKAIRNAVRSGQDVDIEGVLRNMNAKLSDKSLSRLKAELKHSELGAKIKFDFGDNKKDIEALKRVWRHATPSEKDEINSILRDKYKKKSISRDTLDMFDVNK